MWHEIYSRKHRSTRRYFVVGKAKNFFLKIMPLSSLLTAIVIKSVFGKSFKIRLIFHKEVEEHKTYLMKNNISGE